MTSHRINLAKADIERVYIGRENDGVGLIQPEMAYKTLLQD